MNYVALQGGLGNQMFVYAFKIALSQTNRTILFHPYRKRSPQYGYAGYQLEQIFRIPKERFSSRLHLNLLYIYWFFVRLFPRRHREKLYRVWGIKELHVPENFVYYGGILDKEYDKTLFRGTWQSEKYFSSVSEEVRSIYSFNEVLLNQTTKLFAEKILTFDNPVSIHIRRNDYLSPKYNSGFGGICTKEYYNKAIAYIKEYVKAPVFIVFSDDIDWCKNNFDQNHAIFVDWNIGTDSWQDMFLMSKCKHNIIANSSFSWWGAWLNTNLDKIVIAPKVWWNGIKDDVVPDSWIRM